MTLKLKSSLWILIYLSICACTKKQTETILPNSTPPQTLVSDLSYTSDWHEDPSKDRHWAGPAYWLNPLQAWQQTDGQLQNVVSGGDRNAVILTKELIDNDGSFEIDLQFDFKSREKVETNIEETSDQSATDGTVPDGLSETGWAGIQLGLQGQFDDYRDDAIKGIGLCVGVTQKGHIFIGSPRDGMDRDENPNINRIQITAYPEGDSMYELSATIYQDSKKHSTVNWSIHKSWLEGLMALTSSQSIPAYLDYRMERPPYTDLKGLNKKVGGNTYVSFRSVSLSGSKIESYPERAFGPILWTQHTFSNGILNMSVQMTPIGNQNNLIDLTVDDEYNATAMINPDGNNALFSLNVLDPDIDHRYTVSYKTGANKQVEYSGVIPASKPQNTITHAALSCVDDRGFPHQDLVDNVASHNPDILSFHGDQLYERVGEYGVERNSKLDYLRKWYVFGWSFGELMRNRPTIIIPDDHDVFHGNLWGEGGKAADVSGGYGYDAQDSGGYKEPPDFVNMVHRTQTGHLPACPDPTPILQDISVYYTSLDYKGVSFAILGDRMWKSAPKQYLPEAEIENGWPQNTSWDPKTEAYHPNAELLGPRQELFLKNWAEDWAEETVFKTVISQSPFCNVATLPADIWHDKYVPTLPRYKKGEYPPDDRPVADFDSNGWPQNKRNDAIKTIRKAFALHVTGDQHLGSTGQYGVDQHGDSGFWISSPAVANLWPRRWFPATAATSGKDAGDSRRYTGDYEDGFGNKITVKAIANPYDIEKEPSMVYDKAPGYAIINYDLTANEMELAVWPKWEGHGGLPYEGWPVTISKMENYGQEVTGYLGMIELKGSELVKVFNEESDELIYSVRPNKQVFIPKVFDNSIDYRVEVIDGDEIVLAMKNQKAKAVK